MRIAYIAAGAAGMYCGSCLHDNTVAAALRALGEDVILIPTYTPLRTDEPSVSHRRIFLGGVNVYLQQRWNLFRRTPQWLDRIFDHPTILERLAKRSVSVNPRELGDMTVSMLRGEEGHQRKEIEKLAHWLLDDLRPDVAHLSNSMLLGMARPLKARGGPPIVCQLSGEDLFLEKLPAEFLDRARALLRERAAEVDAFVAINRYYADFMADYLDVARERIHIIPHGLNLDGHGVRMEKEPHEPRTIGYLARVCEDKGLHLLVEACELLASRNDVPSFVVRAAGYLAAADRPYLAAVEGRAASGPLAGRFHYVGEVDRNQKIAFLQSLDVFSVPTVYRESKGIPALEALANAVPVVLPDHGSFPEIVADTGGGLLHRALDPADLAAKLAELLANPVRATQLGLAGQESVRQRYHAAAMAQQTLALYRQLTGASALPENQQVRVT